MITLGVLEMSAAFAEVVVAVVVVVVVMFAVVVVVVFVTLFGMMEIESCVSLRVFRGETVISRLSDAKPFNAFPRFSSDSFGTFLLEVFSFRFDCC